MDMGWGMRWIGLAAVLLAMAACAPVPGAPTGARGSARMVQPAPDPGPLRTPEQAASAFAFVVSRVETVAEGVCRARTRNVPCDFQIVLDTRGGQAPNAFQTLDSRGRPVIGLTYSLLEHARNVDELAFVLGHETSHHILGHILRQRETARKGAVLAGVLAEMGGADARTVRSMQEMGASLSARSFSKEFELEADALGTEITIAAGYDPVHGAQFFMRLPDPGNKVLGSHPPNARRIAVVRQTAQRLGYVSTH